jgi:hypothetical protein
VLIVKKMKINLKFYLVLFRPFGEFAEGLPSLLYNSMFVASTAVFWDVSHEPSARQPRHAFQSN